MRSTKSWGVITVTAASACVAGAMMFPAVASAAGPDVQAGSPPTGFARDWPHNGNWYHPEWGPGWNNGYPAPGWIPPAGWAPPPDWAPPAGWYPPPGYAPPPNWVGPCAGPLFNLFHPIRCA
jgi:hypothetical protein